MASSVETRLTASKISSLNAKIGELQSLKGGRLLVTTNTNFSKSDDESSISSEVEITAAGVSADATDTKEYSFKIFVKVVGNHDIVSGKESVDLDDENFRLLLAQPLYVLGVSEVLDLGQKLGYSNLTLPWDIRTMSTMSEQGDATPEKPTKTKRKPKVIAKGK